jgi:hypothetical protein
MSTGTPTLDPERLDALLGQAVGEFGATVNAALVVIGDRLGLYRALAEAEALTSTQLAQQTGTAERYVREWLNAQAASGYVEYDAAACRYALNPEQAAILADESGPAFVGGGFQIALGAAAGLERIQDAFLTGAGMGWHEHAMTCSRVASDSSSPATAPTSSTPGSPPSRACTSGFGRAGAWQMWAAATESRRS